MGQYVSDRGIAFLERHEGVVLRAYRDPVGIWTIGAGLTAASGVVTPRAGMTITPAQASAMLSEAIERRYAPAVLARMEGCLQHEFDGGTSFHFNTGAIGRASWVEAWRRGDAADTRRRLAMWKKGGGRVLPGLVRRRREEADLILKGDYGDGQPAAKAVRNQAAGWVAPMDESMIPEIADGLREIGYASVTLPSGSLARAAVEAFQRDHGLTVDGVVGRATLSTLQRRLDVASKAKTGGATGAGSAAGATSSTAVGDPQLADTLALAGWIGIAVATLYLLWLAYRYRDAVAAKINRRLPRLAALLRSF